MSWAKITQGALHYTSADLDKYQAQTHKIYAYVDFISQRIRFLVPGVGSKNTYSVTAYLIHQSLRIHFQWASSVQFSHSVMSFHLAYIFLCCTEAFNFNQIPSLYFHMNFIISLCISINCLLCFESDHIQYESLWGEQGILKIVKFPIPSNNVPPFL